MYLPIFLSVKGVIVSGCLLFGLSFIVLWDHLKDKADYASVTGQVVYIDEALGDLPKRHIGDYRYLIVDTYPFPFEIYQPNSEPTALDLDSLQTDDRVTVYYFERNNTYENQLNRFAQFVDRGNTPVFVRDGFQKRMGYWMIAGSIGVMLLGLVLGKTGHLPR